MFYCHSKYLVGKIFRICMLEQNTNSYMKKLYRGVVTLYFTLKIRNSDVFQLFVLIPHTEEIFSDSIQILVPRFNRLSHSSQVQWY